MSTSREQASASINGTVEQVFALLDDHARLSSHMNAPSWQMGGGRMETIVDVGQGRIVGSHIVLRGRAFGLQLFVEEVVTVREPPVRKVWETLGTPQLLVMGPYRMSFELAACGSGSHLSVQIEYELPARGVARALGRIFGRMYARWCVRHMASDAAKAFASRAAIA